MTVKAQEPRVQTPSLAAGYTPSLSGGVLRVPARRGPWTFMVSPVAVRCYHGQILPRLAKAWHEPGLNGNGRHPGRGEGAIAKFEGSDWRRIPHDIACVAFGENRPGSVALESTYLNHHRGRLGKAMVSYYTDAWHRPRSIGPMTTWQFDPDGWADFLARCWETIWPGELDEVQIRLAVDPLVRRFEAASRRDSIPAQQVVEAVLLHLPPKHDTPRIAALRKERKQSA